MYGMGGVRRDRPSENIFSKSSSFSGSLKCTGLRWGLELEKSGKKVRSSAVSTALIYLEKVVREQKHFYVFAPPPLNKGHMSCLQHRLRLSTPQSHVRTRMCLWCMGGGFPRHTYVCVSECTHKHIYRFCEGGQWLTNQKVILLRFLRALSPGSRSQREQRLTNKS